MTELCPELLETAVEFMPDFFDYPSDLRLVNHRIKELIDKTKEDLDIFLEEHLEYVSPSDSLLAKVTAVHSDGFELDSSAVAKIVGLKLPKLRYLNLGKISPTVHFMDFYSLLNISSCEVLDVDQETNSGFAAEYLSEAQLPNLKSLSAPAGSFNYNLASRFSNSFPRLEYLNLSGCSIDKDGIAGLAQGLTNLKTLYLSGVLNGLGSLANAQWNSLEYIDLEGGVFTLEDAHQLSGAGWLQNVDHFELFKFKIETPIVADFFSKGLINARRIHLGQVVPDGLTEFNNTGIQLPKLMGLRFMGLHGNWDEGLATMFTLSLPALQRFEIQLSLNKTPLISCHFPGLAANTWPNLQHLVLQNIRVSAVGIERIGFLLDRLISLELRANRLDDECASILGGSISYVSNCPLKQLVLARNNISEVGLMEILDSGEHSPGMQIFDISENPIGVEGVRLLREAEAQGIWPCLRTLRLPDIGEEGVLELARNQHRKWKSQHMDIDTAEEDLKKEIINALRRAGYSPFFGAKDEKDIALYAY